MAWRRENPAAPVAKTITVAEDRNRGDDDDVIRRRQIGNAREMDIEHCDQRSGLRELVLQFIADPKFQSRSLRAATEDHAVCGRIFACVTVARLGLNRHSPDDRRLDSSIRSI